MPQQGTGARPASAERVLPNYGESTLADLGESLLALQLAVERLIATVKTGNGAEFGAIMNRGRAYLDVRAAARAS